MTIRLLAIGVLCAIGFLCASSGLALAQSGLNFRKLEWEYKETRKPGKGTSDVKRGSKAKTTDRMGGGGGTKAGGY